MITHENLTFLKGFCSGLFYTFIPIYGIIIISHFASKRKIKSALAAVLGMVCAQLIWAVCAWLIFLLIASGLRPNSPTLTLVGMIILFVLAARVYRQQQHLHLHQDLSQDFYPSFSVGFLCSFSFPSRILGFFSLFTILQIEISPKLKNSLDVLAGLTLGSLLFWVLLTLLIAWKNQEVSPKVLQSFHKASALILMAFIALGLFKIYL